MSAEEALAVYRSLPADARRRVDKYMLTLSAEAAHTPIHGTSSSTPIELDPFIGMWRERQDLADSTGWVRELRSREWSAPRE